MPKKNNIKGGKVYSGLQFQRFHSMIGWLHYFGFEVWKNIMVDKQHVAEAAHFIVARRQGSGGGAGEKERKGMGPSKAGFQ
jgi:hypothetical protein